MENKKLVAMSIKSKINAIKNYNGQLATIQSRTQEAVTLLRFSLDNELIDKDQAKELGELLKETYEETIKTATFERIINY